MKNKHTLLLIPTIIFPYAFVALIVAYFFSQPVSEKLYGFVNENMALFGVALLVLFALSVVFNIIYIIATRKISAFSVLEAAFVVKCIHIPTYVFIFAFGLLMGMVSFMTFPLILFFAFMDLLTLFLSDFISIYALAKCLRKKGAKPQGVLIMAMICQFFFCLDVISVSGAYLLKDKG